MLAPGGVGGPVDGAVRAPLRIALAVMLIQQSRAASLEDARATFSTGAVPRPRRRTQTFNTS